ncbi:homoserine dehydrogenase [Lactiplantibacillus garii]|uniref:Homoserine dehydrogenase n=1 Tax=Lactiplantibacillus garii TaxID=2306423 RepID=A0A426DA59_9LACO|nr:homoserine dehydrogenase [Lactiplantibacillus garii]RRK11509.1 homoserine dehydrogenase [Lactiplantibacillus garii]
MTTTIEVGMLGLGTVGSGVVERLSRAAVKIEQTQGLRFHLATVAVNHLNAPRTVSLPLGTQLTDSIDAVVTDPQIQLVIEVMGTLTTAKRAITTALKHGKSVVTANKDLIATAGETLVRLAQREGCDLFYEASVAGGIPILRTLTDSYATDTVQSVAGIINGTANYVLSAMTRTGQTYEQALRAAQRAGYAEADPTNDVGGLDATYKLIILSRFAFGQSLTVEQVRPVGITAVTTSQCQLAATSGWQLKLLAQAQRHGNQLYCRVAPVAVGDGRALSRVNGVQNGVAISSQAIGESLYTGPGAGSTATANSVLNDVIAAGQRLRLGTRGPAFNRNAGQLGVKRFDQLPQAYLLFTTLPSAVMADYANEAHFSLKPLSRGSYQTSTLSPVQLAQLQATRAITAIPIADSVAWEPVSVAPLPIRTNIAI